MKNKIVFTASLFGMLAVIAGAFGAHALQSAISPRELEVWHTAVQYQFYHVFALLFLSFFASINNRYSVIAYYLFTVGIVFFSGSLYLLSCRELLGWGWLIYMGPVTPLGGLLFIGGWFTLAFAALKNP